MAKLKPIRIALLSAVAAVAVVGLGVMLWGDFVGAEAEQAAAKSSTPQPETQGVPTVVDDLSSSASREDPVRGEGDGGDGGGGDGEDVAGGDGGAEGAESDETSPGEEESESGEATGAKSHPHREAREPPGSGSAASNDEDEGEEDEDEKQKTSAAAAGAGGATTSDDPPPSSPVVGVAKRGSGKGAASGAAPVADQSLIPRQIRDATGQQPVKNVKCVQQSLDGAGPEGGGGGTRRRTMKPRRGLRVRFAPGLPTPPLSPTALDTPRVLSCRQLKAPLGAPVFFSPNSSSSRSTFCRKVVKKRSTRVIGSLSLPGRTLGRYSTARPQEAGLNWDRATTTEDFFVHRQNRGPTSAMPPELLPADAAAVTGKMKWTSCALVGNSAVLLSGGVSGFVGLGSRV